MWSSFYSSFTFSNKSKTAVTFIRIFHVTYVANINLK